jgi:hypothetical protein
MEEGKQKMPSKPGASLLKTTKKDEATFAEAVQLISASRDKPLQALNTVLIDLYWEVRAAISRKIQEAEWGDGVVAWAMSHRARIRCGAGVSNEKCVSSRPILNLRNAGDLVRKERLLFAERKFHNSEVNFHRRLGFPLIGLIEDCFDVIICETLVGTQSLHPKTHKCRAFDNKCCRDPFVASNYH